jgi:REP element-mobilizing transposase RayT
MNGLPSHPSRRVPTPEHLPRLPKSAYLGTAIVHWTLSLRDRGTGWLDPRFTRRFRWLLLHACSRYGVDCPIHCLMPDHVHLLLHGCDAASDQRRLIRFLRRHTQALLAETGHAWQPQAYDHVLRSQESDRLAYETLVRYIAQNPVRAGLVQNAGDWPHTGAVVPGYPELEFGGEDFWLRYWRLRKSRQQASVP